MNTLGLIHFPHSLHWYERRLCPKLLGALSSTAILPVPLHQWHFIFLDVFELMVVDEFTFVVLFVVIVVLQVVLKLINSNVKNMMSTRDYRKRNLWNVA